MVCLEYVANIERRTERYSQLFLMRTRVLMVGARRDNLAGVMTALTEELSRSGHKPVSG